MRQIKNGGMSKMKTLMAVFLAMLSVITSSPADLYAQAGATGAITGTVLDQKGGAIAGAIVVVTNLATGQKEREVVSTGAGTFNIPSLPPSRYSLEITAQDFQICCGQRPCSSNGNNERECDFGYRAGN